MSATDFGNELDRKESLLWGETRSPIALPLSASSGAYVAALRVKSGAARVYGFTGYNSNTAAQFIQLHNTIDAPASGAVPVVILSAAGSSNFFADYTYAGRFFRAGVWIVNSSTGATYTAGAADCWFDVQYI